MSSRQRSKKPHSLASRLTLWYAVIFALSSIAVFLGLYASLSYIIKTRVDKELSHEFSEIANAYGVVGLDGIKKAMLLEAQSDGVDKLFLRLLSKDGKELSATSNAAFGAVPVHPGINQLLPGENNRHFETFMLPQEEHEVRMLYGQVGQDMVLQVVFSQKEENAFLQVFRRVVAVALVVLTAVAAFVGWVMSHKALKGVEEIISTAHEITAGSLARRVEVKRSGDEIERLAITFNIMLDRIESLIASMRELTDNIAHDLRSPIARMRSQAESALFAGIGDEQSENLAAATIEECDRLLGMINTMLDISEVEVGADTLELKEIDIAGLVCDGCELFEPIAEEKEIAMKTDLPVSLFIKGDRQKLQRVVANLLDNALKYGKSGGTVSVRVYTDAGNVYLVFQDDGIGIGKEQLPHIFKRFYRCDKSRSQAGVGLGLSLARALCRAHGGDITATSTLGGGSTFTIVLPCDA